MDSISLITIMWAIFGAIGTALLGLISAGIIALVKATINNTTELRVLSKAIRELAHVPAAVEKIKGDVDNIHQWKRDHEKKHP